MLEIHIVEPDAVLLSGRFDGAGAETFDRQFPSSSGAACPNLLDFSGVSFLSSAGIRVLVRLAKSARNRGVALSLASLQAQVAQALEVAGLLDQFAVFSDLESARAARNVSGSSQTPPAVFLGRSAERCLLPSPGSSIAIWRGKTDGVAVASADALVPALLSELPLSVGHGGFGTVRADAADSPGFFMTARTAAILSPLASPQYPDFLVSDNPDSVSMFVSEAACVLGKPALFVRMDAAGMSLGEFAAALPDWLGSSLAPSTSDIAFLLHAQSSEAPAESNDDLLALGFVSGSSADRPSPLRTFRKSDWIGLSSSAEFCGAGLLLSGRGQAPSPDDPAPFLAEAISPDRLRGVAPLRPELRLGRISAWIFLPERIVPAEDLRLKIDVEGGESLPDEWDVIVRRIYGDSGRVALAKLSGGYSSTTFRADSFDRDGRRTIPTVLKIGSIEITRAEVDAYHACVKKFILNNSTVIMGHAAHGNWAGLRYNFVGVNGADSSLSWLADHYARRSAEEILPLVDVVFGRVLWPWYGQAKRETIRPFEQHAPAARFFPDIAGEAEKVLGISSDDPLLSCPELGRDLPNPFHCLKHRYPEWKSWERPWHSAITHGDLNLNNILVDEKENVYVVDFSETRPRNAVADFARIEPVVSLQFPRLDDSRDFRDLLLFLEGLASVSPLLGDPPLRYSGSDPMVPKAWQVVCRLRSFARKTVGGENQPVFYWLPVLEWTLPCVYFRQLSTERKRLWAFSAAFLCEQILAHFGEWPMR